MGLRNRYLFIKRIYPNYLIIFLKNKKYISYGEDQELLEYLKLNNLDKLNVNYLILNNMTIEKRQSYQHNLYPKYYLEYHLINLVIKIIEKENS